MTKSKPLPTQQELHELFDYSVITGELYWKENRGSRARKGNPAGGCNSLGYKFIRISGKLYNVSRLVWVWVTGEDPGTLQVDHIDGCRDNNAWHNLRTATNGQNNRNKKDSKGYYFCNATKEGNPWVVKICTNYKSIPVGRYRTEAEAAAAYREASLKHHGEFSRYSRK